MTDTLGVEMATDAELAAIAEYPELQKLVELRAAGWIFQVISHRGVIQVKGMYVWQVAGFSWADIIQIRYITDTAAVRLNPNKELVWKFEGDLVGAIDGLLELPHPGALNAPRLVIGSPRRLWTP